MSDKLKFSIITVCLNAEKELTATLESIQKQDYPNVEVVLVDGGSTDKTLEAVKIFTSALDLNWISEKDNGIYDAMNKGVAMAKGDIIYFLNAGDRFVDKEVLSKVSTFFKNEWQIAYGQSISVDKKTGKMEEMNLPKADALSLYVNLINHQSIFAKASVFRSHGDFNSTYQIYADYDWYLRAVITSGFVLHHMAIPICYYERGGFSDSNYWTIGVKERDAVKQKYYKSQYGFLKIIFARQYLWLTRRALRVDFIYNFLVKYLLWRLQEKNI